MSITTFKVNIDAPRLIFQGDYAEIEGTINTDLTGYKVRCEIYDKYNNSVELGNTASGGGDSQISVIEGTTSTFLIKIPKDNTDSFREDSFLEIEIENAAGNVFTIYKGTLKIIEEKIEWTSPS